jgi:hypothetical protein
MIDVLTSCKSQEFQKTTTNKYFTLEKNNSLKQLSFAIDFQSQATHVIENCHSCLKQVAHDFQLHMTFHT